MIQFFNLAQAIKNLDKLENDHMCNNESLYTDVDDTASS